MTKPLLGHLFAHFPPWVTAVTKHWYQTRVECCGFGNWFLSQVTVRLLAQMREVLEKEVKIIELMSVDGRACSILGNTLP